MALVLGRYVEEAIILETSDGPIEIVISRVEGKHVHLAIKAPRCVSIYRKELAKWYNRCD